MYILGVYYGHNATAVLLRNGKVLAAASEERFNGKKNFVGFPKQAISFVLKSASITSADLDLVTIPLRFSSPAHTFDQTKQNTSIQLFRMLYIPISFFRRLSGSLSFYIPLIRSAGIVCNRTIGYFIGAMTNRKERNEIAKYMGISKEKVKGYDHHLSHAAASYYASPFNTRKTLAFTLDGEGDFCSGSVIVFDGDTYNVLARIPRESSLGNLYTYLTMHLGMKSGEHEYKVMGLAPYAKQSDVEELYQKIQHIVKVDPDTLTIHTTFNTMDTEQFIEKHMKRVRFDLMAAVFQKLLEEKITEWVKCAIKKTGVHTVVLGGGVFMNVKVNQRIAELPEVKNIFTIPSCGDESSVLGSSYVGYVELCKKRNAKVTIEPIETVYWGPAFSQDYIEFIAKRKLNNKYSVKKVKNIEKEIAILLSKGYIVARLNSKMEFGARALGNRSILADPRNPSVIKIINEQVKNRDFWMPFAPSILYERQHDYIINPKNIDANYMMISFNTTSKAKKDLVAAMHPYDYTVRPQIVKEKHNPSYYKIIREFEKLTGIAGILNTSFNLHGYPIVLGPKEALYTFENSGIPILALGDFLIRKK